MKDNHFSVKPHLHTSRNHFVSLAAVSSRAGVVLICVFLVFCCAKSVNGRIRFCETFQNGDIPVREDSVFSAGTVSMLVEVSSKLDSNRFNIVIFKCSETGETKYGAEIFVPVNTAYTSFRFDDILSFSDTGRFIVRIATPDGNVIARNSLQITSLTR
jgi:hypothetical protein